MVAAIAEAIPESRQRGRPQRRRPDVCSAVNPRFSNSSRLFVDRCSLTVDEGQDPAGYPGAAAHCRAGRGTGFRGADEERKCIEHRSLPLNINGANTYQFVVSNPVGNVDPWGLAAGVTGKGVPATAPGSAPGSGSVTVTGKSGPIPTGIPGTTVSVGATGTASTGGNYTGSVTGTAKANTGGGSSVSVGVTATGSGKITKNPKSPNGGVQVKCQVSFPVGQGPLVKFFATYNPLIQQYSGGAQLSVGKSDSIGVTVQPGPGGPNYMVTGTFGF